MRNASKHPKSGQSGVTIVELLVVCVVIGIIAAFAFMQRGTADAQFKRQNVAQSLKSAFERARFDSVKRRAECDAQKAKVFIDATSFTLTTDSNQDRVLDASDNEVTDFSGQDIVISGNVDFGLPVTVVFNQRGEATLVGAGGATNPTFFVCNVGCGSMPNPNANIIIVTPTGTVNMLAGTAAIPVFGAPGGTVVGTGDEINDNMVLSTSTGCS